MCNTCGCKSAETFDADSRRSWSEENRTRYKDARRRKTSPSDYNPVCVYCGEGMWVLGPYEMRDGSRVGNYQKEFFLMGCRNEDCRNYGYGAEEFEAEDDVKEYHMVLNYGGMKPMKKVLEWYSDDFSMDEIIEEFRELALNPDLDKDYNELQDVFLIDADDDEVKYAYSYVTNQFYKDGWDEVNAEEFGAEGLYECSECKHWNRNPVAGITKCKKCGHGSFNQVKRAETFGADVCSSCEADTTYDCCGVCAKCLDCCYCDQCSRCLADGSRECVCGDADFGAEAFGAERRYRYGNRYITRNSKGQIKKNVSVGRSLAADRRRKAKTVVKGVGQGGSGDYRAEDIVESLQSRTRRAGFSINGWVASALVIGASFVAGQRFEKR